MEPQENKKVNWKRLLTAILFVILTAGLVGGSVWYVMDQQARDDKESSDKQSQELQKQVQELRQQSEKKGEESKKTTKDVAENGTIDGALTYPSEGIPDDLTVYAENVDTGELYSTTEQISDISYSFGVGYQILAPAGNYYVYASRSSDPTLKAYHNQYILCGMTVSCTDTTKVAVTVTASETTDEVIVGDWWNAE